MNDICVDCTHPEEGLTMWGDGDVKLSEDFFWKTVKIINWEWLSRNLDNVDRDLFKYKLLKKYDLKVWKEVKEVYSKKFSALRELLRSYDTSWRVGTGDDGTWDLCAHVVGLGREVFLEALQNPESLIARGRQRDYKENFGYWIPSDDKCNIPNSIDFIEKED